MDGFVDRLHALRFLRACDPSYRALTFTLVGLPPTGHISLLLDILFGSFLPSLRSSSNHSLLGSRSRHCYAIKFSPGTPDGRFPGLNHAPSELGGGTVEFNSKRNDERVRYI